MDNSTKRWISGVVVVIIAILLVVVLPGGDKEASGEPIQIGALVPLSGGAAQYGEWVQNGINLAIEEVNSNGGVNGRALEALYEDTQANPQTGVSAFRKLRSTNNVNYFITMVSGVSLAISPLANSEEVIQMEAVAASPDYRKEGDYTYRTAITSFQLAEAEAQVLRSRGIKNVAFLYLQNEFGEGMRRLFAEKFSELGGTIVVTEAFPETSSDFRTQLNKIKQANPEAIVLVSYIQHAGTLLNQKKELGLTMPIYTDVYAVEGPIVIETAKDAAEGVFYVTAAFDKELSKETASYQEAYLEAYGEDPVQMSSQAYDAVIALSKAMEECREVTPACVKETLADVDFIGASGKIKFDETGDVVEKPTALKTIKNGEFVLVEE